MNEVFINKYIENLIKEITECIEKFHINVAVAKLYIFLNNLNEEIDKKTLNEQDIINAYKKYLMVISELCLHYLFLMDLKLLIHSVITLQVFIIIFMRIFIKLQKPWTNYF